MTSRIWVLLTVVTVALAFAELTAPLAVGLTPTPTPTPARLYDPRHEPSANTPTPPPPPARVYIPGHEPKACDCDKIKEILDSATEQTEVYVDCDVDLSNIPEDCKIPGLPDSPEDITITKKIFLAGSDASGITFDCGDATIDGGEGTPNSGSSMIQVMSLIEYCDQETKSCEFYEVDKITVEDCKKASKPCKFDRPENITIENCNIIGSVRVFGMGANGEAPHVKESSRREIQLPSGHVERARNSAPTNIVFDHVTITGVGRNPVYFSPGVTYSKLINSEIRGRSDDVGIYLDAESCCNTIKDNKVHVDTYDYLLDRPQMAIDASSYNRIMNNEFSGSGFDKEGGIFLYRNCGQGGTIRHSTPSYNLIINNIFTYGDLSWYVALCRMICPLCPCTTSRPPAVYLGSRDGGWLRDGWLTDDVLPIPWAYCDADDGRPYGSSVSQKDHAQYNAVMQNQILNMPVEDAIKTRNQELNSPNYFAFNETVTTVKDRRAGCYVPEDRYNKRAFIFDGQTIDVLEAGNRGLTCFNYACNDGDLSRSSSSSCKACTVERWRLSALLATEPTCKPSLPTPQFDQCLENLLEWHNRHDEEVARLRERLESPECQ